MVTNKKILTITLAVFCANSAYGAGLRQTGKIVQNVANYMAKKSLKEVVKPVSSCSNITKPILASKLAAIPAKTINKQQPMLLSEFNPLATNNAISSKLNALQFTVKDALEKCKGRYAILAHEFAEVAMAMYSPSNIVDFMSKTNTSAIQMSIDVAKTSAHFAKTTAKYVHEINQKLLADLQAAGLGAEVIANLKTEAQIAINAVQKISEGLKSNAVQIFQESRQAAIDFAKINNACFAKIAQQASENPKTSHGLFAATILAGTAGYMGYEANEQSKERKNRKMAALVEDVSTSTPVVAQEPAFETPVVVTAVTETPKIDAEVEEAKRQLAQADAAWDALQALDELKAATQKPFIAIKNGELAVGPVGIKASNIPGYSKAKDLSASAYTSSKDLASRALNNTSSLISKVKDGITDNRVTNYLGSTKLGKWFSSTK